MPIEADSEIAQHLKSVSAGDIELVADVGNGDSLPYIRRISLLGNDCSVVLPSIGNQPTICSSGKIILGLGLKLVVGIDPADYFLIGDNYSAFR